MSAWGDIPTGQHVESFQEWIDEGIEPVSEEEVPNGKPDS